MNSSTQGPGRALRKPGRDVLALDVQGSVRTKDANGFLHVAVSNITKEAVNPYLGKEIPGWEERGLDPARVYWGYRAGDELEKAAGTFSGLPLLLGHHIEDAEDPQKLWRVGSLGTDARWEAPYVKAALTVTDAAAISAIESGEARELSCAYRYEPDWRAGQFEGVNYDFVMRAIQGNHCALVAEGRAGADVVVADAAPRSMLDRLEDEMMNLIRKFRGAKDNAETERKEVDLAQAIIDLHKINPETGEVMDVTEDEEKAAAVKAAVDAIAGKLEPEEVEALVGALEAFGEPAAPAGDEDEPAASDEDAPASDEDEPAKDEDAPASDEDEPAADEDAPAIDEDALKAAADACGADADDPAFQAAFAEGVKYGEKHGEPERPAGDEDAPASAAMDAAMKGAAGRAAREAEARITARFRSMSKAAEAVRPVVGPVDVFAFDSAQDIYGAALRVMGVDTARHPAAAWKSMYEFAREVSARAAAANSGGGARTDYEGSFEGLNRIRKG